MATYQAFYRTHRPKSFSDVVGQDYIIESLSNAIAHNLLNHAYLFCGHRGTGKTTIAKIFAKNINCLKNNNGIACEQCENCRLINEANHPDIFEIDAASNNGVDEIREIINHVKFAPMKLLKKIYIVDEVHMLSKGAFNALLKTLEEPPSHVVFILATTEPEKIPVTVLSRCQRFDFLRIKNSIIERRLSDVAKIESITIDAASINLIAKLAEGSMRDALNILDKVNTTGNNITLTSTFSIMGLMQFDYKRKIISAIAEGKIIDIIKYVKELDESGINISNSVVDLLYLFRDLLILKTTKDDSQVIYFQP